MGEEATQAASTGEAALYSGGNATLQAHTSGLEPYFANLLLTACMALGTSLTY